MEGESLVPSGCYPCTTLLKINEDQNRWNKSWSTSASFFHFYTRSMHRSLAQDLSAVCIFAELQVPRRASTWMYTGGQLLNSLCCIL